MARIRSIKPEFFLNEQLAELPALHRLAFIGLWTQADREGRFLYRPRRLKASILPYDDCDFDQLCHELSERGFVRLYEVDGEQCGRVAKFLKHQMPHHREAASIIPPDPDEPETGPGPDKGQPLLSLGLAAQEGKGREQEGKGREGARAVARPLPDDFTQTAEMAERVRERGCRDPTLNFEHFRLHYEGLKDNPDRGWFVNWPNKYLQWTLHHDQYGCPCQSRTPLRGVRTADQIAAAERGAAAIFGKGVASG